MNSLQDLHQTLCQYKQTDNVSNICISVSTPTPKIVQLSLSELSEKDQKEKFDEVSHHYSEYKKLLQCIRHGTLEEVKIWITAFRVFNPNESLLKALKQTSNLDYLSKAKFLIEEMHVSPHAIIENYGTLLKFAAEFGNLNLVKYLVEVHKVNVEANGDRPETSATALCVAARGGFYDIAKYLIQNKASTKPLITQGSQRYYLLYWGVLSGSLEMVKLLVENGAYIFEHREVRTSMALFEALEKGYLDIVKYFLQRGIAINSTFSRPIFIAVRSGNLELVKLLIETLKQDVRYQSEDKNEFYHLIRYARRSRDVNTLRYLIDTFKINIGEFVKYFEPNELTVPILRFLFEEKDLGSQKLESIQAPENFEARAYLYSLTTNPLSSKKVALFKEIAHNGLASCELSVIKFYKDNHYPSLNDNKYICLTARRKILQLYLVKPLLQFFENKCCTDIAEHILSYVDFFSSYAEFYPSNSPDAVENKKFIDRILLGIPKGITKPKGIKVASKIEQEEKPILVFQMILPQETSLKTDSIMKVIKK